MTRSKLRLAGVVTVGLAATASISLWSAAPVAAHTGRSAASVADGISHPVSGIDHLLAMVAVGVLAAGVRDRRVAWLTPVGFVIGMIGGGLLGVDAGSMAAVEIAIALTVVTLGLGLATSPRVSGWWLPVAAMALGSVHGYAHGAELPAGAVPVLYVAGFVCMTALLHAAGAGIGLFLRRVPTARLAAGGLVALAGVALLVGG
ncbi:MAG: HupE/UreJ family protein [Acidimicrobiia bacterium]|nr:HupE/UreJ family protein [Acidimicrobiia bacterium]